MGADMRKARYYLAFLLMRAIGALLAVVCLYVFTFLALI